MGERDHDFGYWGEPLEKWVAEGHLCRDEVDGYGDGNAKDRAIATKLGQRKGNVKGTEKQRQDAAGISRRWKTSSVFRKAVAQTRRFQT
jgi:hypothetical protein